MEDEPKNDDMHLQQAWQHDFIHAPFLVAAGHTTLGS